MPASRLIYPFVRFFYRHFYNRFAFTYDAVSALVSRGEWREWTRAAIPAIRGPRVLEVAFGTGDLQLDLHSAGFEPHGIDLSPYMIGITQRKLSRRGVTSGLARARVQQLPFPADYYDSIVMTFPPGFIADARAMVELRRVLAPSGRLIWVDAPYLIPGDRRARFLNWAFHITGGAAHPRIGRLLDPADRADPLEQQLSALAELLPTRGWSWQTQTTKRRLGYVHLIVGSKTGP